MMRGANEGVLTLDIGPDPETGLPQVEAMVAAALGVGGGGAAGDRWLPDVARWAWRTRLSVTMMLDLLGQLRERAQDEAIRVFARNLKDLLLAAPAGPRPTMGLDPGVRTGVKVAVVDAHRQAARDRHRLSVPAEERRARRAGRARRADPPATASSSSPSATAPAAARPRSWSPRCSPPCRRRSRPR